MQSCVSSRTEVESAAFETALRGMERYFSAFDAFVATYKELHNVTDCSDFVRRYEDSSACPVYVKYVLYGLRERTDAARRRYTHLFRYE